MWALRSSIKRNFKTINRFGRAVGRSHTYVCNVLSGKHKLTQEEAQEWANALGDAEATKALEAMPVAIRPKRAIK